MGLDQGDGFQAIVGQPGAMAPFFEQAQGQFLVDRVILDQQDIQRLLQFAQRVPGHQFLGHHFAAIAADVEYAAKCCQQFFLRDRLGEKAADADFLAAFGIAAHGAG